MNMAELRRTEVPKTNGKLITILSIDGGGVRGVIPATILVFLESQLQELDGSCARIADYFDVVAGTSTGGIITALLTTPYEENGRPRSARDITSFYHKEGPNIFSKEAEVANQYKSLELPVEESYASKIESLAWKGLSWAITTFLKPKYESTLLRDKIKEYLKEMRLKDTLTNVVIPTYDIKNGHPCVFSTQQAKKDKSEIQLLDVVTSSTAAPFYFRPHEFEADGKKYELVDGGVAANNPISRALAHVMRSVSVQTLLAIREATKTFKNQDISRYSPPDSSNYLVLSLGTGNSDVIQGLPIKDGGLADWFDLPNKSSPLVDVLFQAAEDMVDIYTSTILGDHNSPHNFLRIQDCTMKACEASMDDGSKENLARLEKIGNDLLERSVSIANPETGLQEMMPNTLTRGGAPSNQVATTNRQALISFARKLSEERRRRLGYPA